MVDGSISEPEATAHSTSVPEGPDEPGTAEKVVVCLIPAMNNFVSFSNGPGVSAQAIPLQDHSLSPKYPGNPLLTGLLDS